MKKRIVMLGLLLLFPAMTSLLFTTSAGAVSSSGRSTVVLSPTALPDGRLKYEVDFPAGQDYAAVSATLEKDGTAIAQFFDDANEFRTAIGQPTPEVDGVEGGLGASESVTAQGTAPMRNASSPSSLPTAAIATLHQRRVEAYASIADYNWNVRNSAAVKETYTYDGTNVTAASYWALAGVSNPWWLGGTWQVLSGPNVTIGSVPASNVLVTSNQSFVAETGEYNWVQVRTRGYGGGYGVAGFTFTIDPDLLPYWHWYGEFNVVNVY